MIDGLTRRRFLSLLGAYGAAVVLAGCGGKKSGSSNGRESKGRTAGDIAIMQSLASIELMIVERYERLKSAEFGDLFSAAAKQHREHFDGWNESLRKQNERTITVAPEGVKKNFDSRLAEAGAPLAVAIEMERLSCASYLKVLPRFEREANVKLAGSVYTAEMGLQSILLALQGARPVPAAFGTTEAAAS